MPSRLILVPSKEFPVIHHLAPFNLSSRIRQPIGSRNSAQPRDMPFACVEGQRMQPIDLSGNNQTAARGTPIDCSSALCWVDGDRTLLAELAEVFVQDCPQRMQELEQGVKGSNAELIRQAAHSLKGMVSGFGAYQAKSRAEEMEKLGRDGQVTEAANLLPAVLCEFMHVIEHLKKTDWQVVS